MLSNTIDAIDGWELGNSPNMDKRTEQDVLTMSAPTVLSLPAAIGNASVSPPRSLSINPSLHPSIVEPTPPPQEMNKVMYASSPRVSKLMQRVDINDIEYMRYRTKYNMQVPPSPDPFAVSTTAVPATPTPTTTATTTGGKTKGKKGKPKEKKKSKQQLQNELEESWVTSKIELLSLYDLCCHKLSIAMDPLIQAVVSREPGKNEAVAPMSSLRIDPNAPLPPPSEEELAAMEKLKKANKKNQKKDGEETLREIENDPTKKRLPLGAGGCRALMSALAGGWVGGTQSRHPTESYKSNAIPVNEQGQFIIVKKIETKEKTKKKIKTVSTGYSFLEELMVRNGNINVVGARSISDYLERDTVLKRLTLYNSNIESQGAFALGKSLRFGGNTTLTKLAIDVDLSLGDLGVQHLVRGLETNSTLTDLSLCCCGFTTQGAAALSTLLRSASSNIQLLALRGNAIGGPGLISLAQAIGHQNKGGKSMCKLVFLNIANIGINGSHVSELQAFGKALVICKTLNAINFDYNCIGTDGGRGLISGWEGNAKNISHVSQFVISCSLPANLFSQIYRKSGGGKKKKKKKKKKKNKKNGSTSAAVQVPEIVPDLQLAISWMAKALEKRKRQLAEEEGGK